MKKKILAVLLTAAALGVSACGSSSDTAKEIDANELAESLVSGITYDEELTQLDAEEISSYIDVVDGVEGIMYMSSGSTAEEVVVFTAPDEATAKTMKENTQEFLDDQGESFEDYIPEESKRVEDAVLVQNGNYVVLCVSSDSETAQSIIDEAF